MSSRRAIMSAPVVLALALTLTACAGNAPGDPSGADPSSPSPTTSSAAPSSAAPSSEASASPADTSPSPSPDVLRAKDKKRYGACRDGACEVLVTEGTTFALDPGVAGGMDKVTVTDVDAEGAGVDFDGPGMHIHLYRPAGPGANHANGLAVAVVAVLGDEAVIRLGD